MAESKTYTLWDLLTNSVDIFEERIPLGIEIPMIQRDYAQGRDEDKPNQIRKKFLQDIHTQLLAFQNGEDTAEPLEMDFVYGYLSSGRFIPLDGQQRLTTLYLIHWFVFFKDKAILDHLKVFNKLSYKSRISSREFFENLNKRENLEKIYAKIFLLEESKQSYQLTTLISDQCWFQKLWNHDPTVQSVLYVLDKIGEGFSDIYNSTLTDHRPLAFYLMNISDNGLGDNLYIKMNARGKGLTDFENLKALLEGSIYLVDKDLQKRFARGIDNGWLDAVWLYGNHITKTEDRSRATGTYLLGLITTITELLFHRNTTKEKIFSFSEDILISVYSNRGNILFLIDAMTNICSIRLDGYEDYFNLVYCSTLVEGRVRHNGAMSVIDQVLRAQNIDNPDKLLFFAWLIYINRMGNMEVTDNMRDYLRICRNYINNINQKSRKSFSLTSEIRTEDFGDIMDVFSSVFDPSDVYGVLAISQESERKYIQYEIRKADYFALDPILKPLIHKLEDNNVFRGLLFNIEFDRYLKDELSLIVEDFLSLLAIKDHKEIIRLFISLGYKGVEIARTNIGSMWFWGTENKWHRIMASPDGEIRPLLVKLFELFTKRDRSVSMEEFVMAYWKAAHVGMAENTLNWYLLEYPVMLSKPLYTVQHKEWEVPIIEMFDISSLNGYHCNPFVLELRDREELKSLLKYSACYAQYSDYAWLHLVNGVALSQANHSWVLHRAVGMLGFEELTSRFNLEDIGNDEFRFTCVNLLEDVIPFVIACAGLFAANGIQDVIEK